MLDGLNTTDRERILREVCHSDSHNGRNTHFNAFMHFYTSISRRQGNAFSVSIGKPVFKTHSDIIDAVLGLKQNATLSKSSFQNQAFGEAEELDKEYAARIIVKIAFMIDCASRDDFSDSYQVHNSFPVKWVATQNFIEFLNNTFPTTESRPFHARSSNRPIKAWKLNRRYRIRFVPTNDLVQHLLYDPQASTVKVFHQAAFIKAHLRHTGNLPLSTDFSYSVQRYVESESRNQTSQTLNDIHIGALCHLNFFWRHFSPSIISCFLYQWIESRQSSQSPS